MLHLWSLATSGVHVTPDAGMAEWIDKPITEWIIDEVMWNEGKSFDGEKWTIRLPEYLHLLTAWYMDEYCESLYYTCIDPRGKTLHRNLIDQEFHEDLPRMHIAGISLNRLWYTVDGCYTFTFTYFYGGLPYEQLGSFRFRLARREIGHE